MQATDSYIFYRSWWELLGGLDRDTRDEVVVAINRYVFEGIISEGLSPLAQGVFMGVRVSIDDALRKHEMVVEKRRKAANVRWHANACKCIDGNTKDANACKCIDTEDDTAVTPSQTVVSGQNRQMPTNANFAKSENPPYNPPIIYSSSSSSSSASACTSEEAECRSKLLRWINESMVEQIERVQYQVEKRLTEYGKSNYTRMTIPELATEFYDFDFRVRDYCMRSERTDALSHFQNWLPKIIRKQVEKANEQEYDSKRNQNKETGAISSVSGIDYFGNT